MEAGYSGGGAVAFGSRAGARAQEGGAERQSRGSYLSMDIHNEDEQITVTGSAPS